MSTHDPQHELSPDDIRLRIQALADNELPEEAIEPTLEQIQGSYEYRQEYAELLRIKHRVKGEPVPRASEEWLEHAERRISRRLARGSGMVLFLGSYLILLGYAVFTMFRDPGVPLIVSVLVTTVLLGAAVLLGNAIADRVRESKTDKYRGIIR
ncbi:MAG: hypothetical protein ACOC1I_00085 [Spirochaetota bacterium]